MPAAVTVYTPIRWRRFGWGLTITALLGAVIFVAAQVRGVTVPLLVGFTIAYVLDPVVDRFEEQGFGRTPAIIILLSFFLVITAALGLALGPQIVDELSQVPYKLRELLMQLRPWVERTFKVELPNNVSQMLDALQEELAGHGEGVGSLARSTGSIAKILFGGTVSVLAALGGILMIPVFAFYLLRDYDRLIAEVRELLPLPTREAVSARCREIDQALSSFVRGQLLVAAILAVLYSVGLGIVGLPLALVVGIVSGLGNMIPYLGTTVGVALATLMALLDWHGFGHLALVYLVFVAVQFLEGWIITPRVVGSSVGLSPFLVIVAVLVFGDLFGFFGVLIGVPLAAVLKILLRAGVEQYRLSSFYTGERTIYVNEVRTTEIKTDDKLVVTPDAS